jgi:hypothetical protein
MKAQLMTKIAQHFGRFAELLLAAIGVNYAANPNQP